MNPQAKLTISHTSGSQNSYFETVEGATKVLDEFSEALAKVDKFRNDEEPIFRYEGVGALYSIDLRKCHGAAVEKIDEWAAMHTPLHVRDIQLRADSRKAIEAAGLQDEYQRLEDLVRR